MNTIFKCSIEQTKLRKQNYKNNKNEIIQKHPSQHGINLGSFFFLQIPLSPSSFKFEALSVETTIGSSWRRKFRQLTIHFDNPGSGDFGRHLAEEL